MKNVSMHLLGILVVVILVLVGPGAHALNSRCVANAAELDAALKEWTTVAVDSDPRFVINMQTGVYALPSSNAPSVYQYLSTTPVALELRGGFGNGCSGRMLDARNTIIDGGGFPNARFQLFDVNANTLIEGVTFTGLTGSVQIVHMMNSPATGHEFIVSHVRLVGNTATFPDYTFQLWGNGNQSGARVALDNSLIADNQTASALPIIISTGKNGQVEVTYSTITGNAVSSMGSALVLQALDFPGLEIVYDSSIVWNNGAGVFDLDVSNVSSMPIVFFGQAGSVKGMLSPLSSLMTVDPEFADPMTGDYRLAAGSPLLEAGDPTPVGGLASVDLFGRPRVQGMQPDMGALEGAPLFEDGFE